MSGFGQDVRFAIRLLRRTPGFTTTALLSLVLGIGLNTAVFTVWDSLLLNPLPVEDVASLTAIPVVWHDDSGGFVAGPPVHSYSNYAFLRERNRTFRDLALFQRHPMSLSSGDEPTRATGTFVTASYFPVLGVRPEMGRFFRPDEDDIRAPVSVLVLSHGFWSRHFGADPAVVGREVRVNRESFTVIGVGPPGFRGTEVTISTDFWLPVATYPRVGPYAEWFDVRGMGIFQAIGRLRPGVTRAQAERDLMGLSRELDETFGGYNEGLGARVRPLLEGTLAADERMRQAGYARTLGIAVGLILAIVGLNVAILLSVRGLERRHELALRLSVGAPRGRLVRQLFTENLVLFLAGGVLSLPVGQLCLALLWRLRPPEFAADALDLGLDYRVLLAALVTALVAAVVFGLLPALRSSDRSLAASMNLRGAAPDAASGTFRRWPLRRLLVAAQLALAMSALILAGLYGRSLWNAFQVDLGFDAPSLAVLTVPLGDEGYDEPRAQALYRRIVERARSLPGVEAAAWSENRLLRGGVLQAPVYLDGREEPLTIGDRQAHRTNAVTPGFFATTGIPRVRGRDFDGTDRSDTRRVAIINETMARRGWPGEDPVGQHFRLGTPTDPLIEVIGVARDAKYRHVHGPEEFFIYLPASQRFSPVMTLHVRVEGEPAAVLAPLREEIRSLAPGVPLVDVAPLSRFVAADLWLERASAVLLSAFGLLASVLAAVGMYGVMNQSVSRRRGELAIRMVVGARAEDVLRRVLADGMMLVAVGLVAGSALSALVLKLSKAVSSQLFGVAAFDPVGWVGAALLLAAVALVSCYLPARGAAAIDPAAVLASE